MKKKIQLLCFSILVCGSVFSQDVLVSKIKWNATNTFNVKEGESLDENTTLISNPYPGENKIQWLNENGSVRKTFHVIEVFGTWTNASVDGRMQYEVTDMQFNGSISIIRKDGDVKILIVMSSDGSTQSTELTIDSFQQL